MQCMGKGETAGSDECLISGQESVLVLKRIYNSSPKFRYCPRVSSCCNKLKSLSCFVGSTESALLRCPRHQVTCRGLSPIVKVNLTCTLFKKLRPELMFLSCLCKYNFVSFIMSLVSFLSIATF